MVLLVSKDGWLTEVWGADRVGTAALQKDQAADKGRSELMGVNSECICSEFTAHAAKMIRVRSISHALPK